MLTCPKCNCEYTLVIDSRGTGHDSSMDGYIRRRRECEKCGERFTTYEVTKKDYDAYIEFQRILRKAGYERKGD